MKKILIGLALLLFFSMANAQETTMSEELDYSEGAFNNVLIKDLDVSYDSASNSVIGQATIGNFADQSFHNLTYKTGLLWDMDGEESDLGKEIDTTFSKDTFSIPSQGEVKRKINYNLPTNLLSGNYNFIFQAIDSQGRTLGYDSYPIKINQDSDNFIQAKLDSVFIEVEGEEHDWNEGPSVKRGVNVNLKFEIENNSNKAIEGVMPQLSVFSYSENGDKVIDKKLEIISFKPNEKKQIVYQLPDFTESHSYLAVINFQKDGENIAFPIKGRWVIEGAQGKIFSSGFKNGQLKVEVIGSPFTYEKAAILGINILDKKNKVCFSEQKSIGSLNEETRIVSALVNINEECISPVIKMNLKIDGHVVDSYEMKLDDASALALNGKNTQPAKTSSDKTWLILLIGGVALIGILILVKVIRNKRSNNGLKVLLGLGLGLGLTFFSGGEVRAWKADTGKYMPFDYLKAELSYRDLFGDHTRACTNAYEDVYSRTCGSYYTFVNPTAKQEKCLSGRKNECFFGSCYQGAYHSGTKKWGFNKVSWSKPYHNESFDVGDNVNIKLENIRAWCKNGSELASRIVWNVYSRDTGQLVKSGKQKIGVNSKGVKKSWSIETYELGRYALYIQVYGNYCSPLYHGMIRYFEVEGKNTEISSTLPECGTAGSLDPNKKVYSSNINSWPAGSTFCAKGNNLIGSNPIFPTFATPASWECLGSTNPKLEKGRYDCDGVNNCYDVSDESAGAGDMNNIHYCSDEPWDSSGLNCSNLPAGTGAGNKCWCENEKMKCCDDKSDGNGPAVEGRRICGKNNLDWMCINNGRVKCNASKGASITGKLIAKPKRVIVGRSSILTALRTGGTATGTITYQFNCGDGAGLKPSQTTSTYSCAYNIAGPKTASVIMTQEGAKTTPTANITVNACDPVYSYSCKNIPSCEGKCDRTVQGKCYKKDMLCGSGEIEVSTSYCSGENPPNCKKTCGSCGSSNWTETQIYR